MVLTRNHTRLRHWPTSSTSMKLKLKTPLAEIETEAETKTENRKWEKKTSKANKQLKTPKLRPCHAHTPLLHPVPSQAKPKRPFHLLPCHASLHRSLSPLLSTKPSYRNEHPPPARTTAITRTTRLKETLHAYNAYAHAHDSCRCYLPQPLLLLASNKATASCNPTQPALLQCRPRPTNPCPAGWIIWMDPQASWSELARVSFAPCWSIRVTSPRSYPWTMPSMDCVSSRISLWSNSRRSDQRRCLSTTSPVLITGRCSGVKSLRWARRSAINTPWRRVFGIPMVASPRIASITASMCCSFIGCLLTWSTLCCSSWGKSVCKCHSVNSGRPFYSRYPSYP